MLIRFQVENFLSFNKMENFSMIAGNLKNKPDHVFEANGIKLLNLSAIYGANASGKTNIIKSIDVLKHIVIKGAPKNIGYMYFKEEIGNKDKPTTFEVEFVKNESVYAYGIKLNVNKRTIEAEWLYEMIPSQDEEKMIFERKIESEKYNVSYNESLIKNEDSDRLDFVIEDMKNNYNTLLLNEMNRNKHIEKTSSLYFFKEVYEWFNKDLKICFPQVPITKFEYVIGKGKGKDKKIDRIISSFDTGISKVSLEKIDIDELEGLIPLSLFEDILEDMRNEKRNGSKKIATVIRTNRDFLQISNVTNDDYDIETIKLKHGCDDVSYDFREESDGTRRLFDLLDILLTSSKNKVFIVDELDRSLHPNLTYRFIEFFYKIAADKRIQLIFTTHESKIMDLNLVRQDEIWFVERNQNNESRLYSLETFKERYDKRVEKAYLDGRYGAIPVFSSFKSFTETEEED